MSVPEKGGTYLSSDPFLRQSGTQSSHGRNRSLDVLAIACVDVTWTIKHVLMITATYARCPGGVVPHLRFELQRIAAHIKVP